MRREETASRIRARRLERASTASTRTRAKSRTGTNARIVRDMPGRTWTRGDRANGGETATATTSKSAKSSAASTTVGSKRRATWTRDGSRGDEDAAGRGETTRRLRADASAFEPASVKAQREALEAKMKKVEEEKAKLRAALEGKAREAREKKARDAERAADAARRERAAGNLLSGFRGVRKRNEDEGDANGGFVAPEVKLSQEEIERRAVQRVTLAGTDWQVLDLPSGSQKKWVTKAYRELAKLLHPDKCSAPGAKEAFQKLNKAYGALK